jgi:alcohol dehydrogenase class IV
MVTPISIFYFSKLPRIYFGVGSINQLIGLINNNDEKILLVTGHRSFDHSLNSKLIFSILKSSKHEYYRYQINGEPSPIDINRAIDIYKPRNITLVIAIGGGSVIDAGKAIAAMFCEEGSVKNYLEGVGTKLPSGRQLRLIAIPTTSGTGSEATKNAVISEFGSEGFKKSLRHDNYIPDAAIIDPELIINCPPEITGACGMDAFTQLLESYVSVKSNPMTDALAFSGLERIARSLKKAFLNGNDIGTRSDMAYAALMSGITLANAGLGLVHGFAQPLGSLFSVPHGIACGTMMSAVNKKTISKLRLDSGDGYILYKYSQVGMLFSADKSKSMDFYIDLLIDTIEDYTQCFKIPKLRDYEIACKDFQRIVEKAEMKNHPVKFNNDELTDILEKCI